MPPTLSMALATTSRRAVPPSVSTPATPSAFSDTWNMNFDILPPLGAISSTLAPTSARRNGASTAVTQLNPPRAPYSPSGRSTSRDVHERPSSQGDVVPDVVHRERCASPASRASAAGSPVTEALGCFVCACYSVEVTQTRADWGTAVPVCCVSQRAVIRAMRSSRGRGRHRARSRGGGGTSRRYGVPRPGCRRMTGPA